MSAEKSGPVEVVQGKDLTIKFEGRRCIHARFCVLQAPTVFLANTPGEWIYPDTMDADELMAVARNCPSGAITYEPADPEKVEHAPPVNTLKLRENGPYAVNAEIKLAGEETTSLRRTLCRCGASKQKPYCDGSHTAIGFIASGEPDSGDTTALAVRNGPLTVTPARNGPLRVEGNLEILAGTGRVVARTTETYLCRCGASRNKPFCDGSHVRIRFNDQAEVTPTAETATTTTAVPTLAEWLGGHDRLHDLIAAFYQKVPSDPLLAPVFATMDPKHAEHVTAFIAEVFGGGSPYTEKGGTHAGMIRRHMGRQLTEEQRKRWITLMIETADEKGLPNDPEFRAAFVGYLEWGTRLAVLNSAEGVPVPEGEMPMPTWGWGPPGGPWQG